MRSKIKLSPNTAVVSGQTVNFPLATDRRYHSLHFQITDGGSGIDFSGANASKVSAIRLYLDDKLQRDISAKHLHRINAFNGIANTAGFLDMFFSEPWRDDIQNEEVLGLSLGDVGTARIEIDLTGFSGAAAITAIAVVDYPIDPKTGRLPAVGNIMKYYSRRVGVTSTGPREIIDLPKNLGNYARLHMVEATAADISAMKVEIDSLTIYELTDAQNSRFLATCRGELVPQADVFHVVFDGTDRLNDTLAMVRNTANGIRTISEFKVTPTMASAADFWLIAEVYGPKD